MGEDISTKDNAIKDGVGWGMTLKSLVPFACLFSRSTTKDTFQTKMFAANVPVPMAINPPTTNTTITNKCLLWVLLEGKHGTKLLRVPYNTRLDTYASLVDALLQKYIPSEAKPFSVDDYSIKVKDIRDASFPIDIGSTEDLYLAINDPFAKEKELKIHTTIRLKCNKGKMVKYCNAACKKKHRHKHKKDCEQSLRIAARRVAKLHEMEMLSKKTPVGMILVIPVRQNEIGN